MIFRLLLVFIIFASIIQTNAVDEQNLKRGSIEELEYEKSPLFAKNLINSKKHKHDEIELKNFPTLACSHYAQCLESLENKHRECLMHSSNKHSKISEQSEEAKVCKTKKIELKKKLEGLILRKIELKKDCINNALNSTNLPLPKKQYKKCQKVFNKYLKDDMLKERDHKQNNISLNPNMLLTKRKNFRELRRCNKTKKFWHKQCMILASCCSERDRCSNQVPLSLFEAINTDRKSLATMKC